MTLQDLRKRLDVMEYLGFDESQKMWVYSYRDVFDRKRFYGLMAGKQKVVELETLTGLIMTKE